MKNKKTDKPQKSKETLIPPPVLSVLVILLVLITSIVSATIAANLLHDLLTSVAVFIFTLLILVIVVPYMGLVTGLVDETTLYRTYVLVLKRIPGLDVIIESFIKITQKK